jgi:hypothetical protein
LVILFKLGIGLRGHLLERVGNQQRHLRSHGAFPSHDIEHVIQSKWDKR